MFNSAKNSQHIFEQKNYHKEAVSISNTAYDWDIFEKIYHLEKTGWIDNV